MQNYVHFHGYGIGPGWMVVWATFPHCLHFCKATLEGMRRSGRRRGKLFVYLLGRKEEVGTNSCLFWRTTKLRTSEIAKKGKQNKKEPKLRDKPGKRTSREFQGGKSWSLIFYPHSTHPATQYFLSVERTRQNSIRGVAASNIHPAVH